VALAALALAAWLIGCGGEDRDAPPALSESEIQQFESLGYADWDEQPAADGARGVVVFDRERVRPGFNLITYPLLQRAELVDAEGRMVLAWSGDGRGRWHRAILAADGDLVVAGQE
jgi:hypothetical protein